MLWKLRDTGNGTNELLCNIGNGAMNFSTILATAWWCLDDDVVVIPCRQQCYERSAILATAQWTPLQYWQRRMQWTPPQYWQLHDDACSWPSQARPGQAVLINEFSENLRAPLFNKGFSNEPNFGRIHLAGCMDALWVTLTFSIQILEKWYKEISLLSHDCGLARYPHFHWKTESVCHVQICAGI